MGSPQTSCLFSITPNKEFRLEGGVTESARIIGLCGFISQIYLMLWIYLSRALANVCLSCWE